MNSISQTKISKELIISQRQVVIKLNENKDKDNVSFKNWRPISRVAKNQRARERDSHEVKTCHTNYDPRCKKHSRKIFVQKLIYPTNMLTPSYINV